MAQALIRFAPGLVDAPGPGLFDLLMGAGSLVFVAPCGLPLALGCRRVWQLGYRRGGRWAGPGSARRGHRGSVGGGGAARPYRDHGLCDSAQPYAVLGVCQWINISYLWRPNLRDEADNHLVELAVAGNAAWIVTGNKRDVAAGELLFDGFRVVTPGAWLKEDE